MDTKNTFCDNNDTIKQTELDAWKRMAEKMYRVVTEIRGPLYDHDMHDWERKCDELVSEYILLREKKTNECMDAYKR